MNWGDLGKPNNEIGKLELARRQIDGAVRAFMRREDPLVIRTLLAPASQILRDLNKDNPRSVSSILSLLAEEKGVGASKLWKEFNTFANKLKHAPNHEEVILEDFISDGQIGEIHFCICEYMFNKENSTRRTVSPYMHSFVLYVARSSHRSKISFPMSSFIDKFDRELTLSRVQIRQYLLRSYYKILLKIKKFHDKHPLGF